MVYTLQAWCTRSVCGEEVRPYLICHVLFDRVVEEPPRTSLEHDIVQHCSQFFVGW